MDNFKPAPHIEALLSAEILTRTKYGGHIQFTRMSENIIVVSCEGYVHQDLHDIEALLLKLGCRYHVKRGIQLFDRTCGRTFTYFTEPKDVL